MMKSISVILCIAATMTIASAQSILLDYPGQSQSTTQPAGQCFTLANAAEQLPRRAVASEPLVCEVYQDEECYVPEYELPQLSLTGNPTDLSSLRIPQYGSLRCLPSLG
ncbi:hypothetical protein BCR42DRAFT_427316 [Absidia repens]|uniref:Uncharacterized protein n=1 Tax=Absidia repens TaxID=90262 RepID=A0A1X2HZM5_9FUNG|nr:hypothetical protein BCR42DRAFT_427316 [Absidia repens]